MTSLPLSALLSQTLVAFTIEFDNEFEHRMPHRTTAHGLSPGAGRGAPWLVSMAMWIHCMRHVPERGIPAGELARRAQLSANLAEMLLKRMSRWWGYLRIAPDPDDARAKPPRSAWLVRPSRAGRQAQRVWEPLSGEITERWSARLGEDALDALRQALRELRSRLDQPLPDFLPLDRHRPAGPGDRAGGEDLPALLSGVLYAYAVEFESGSELPLALSANVLRILHPDGVPATRISALCGIAPMGVENSLSLMTRSGHVEIGPAPTGGRARVARLTAAGRTAQADYGERIANIERDWTRRFGSQPVQAVRDRLERVHSSLFEGLEPYPDGWRAQVPRPQTLPHFPIVSHRGGFPDGS